MHNLQIITLTPRETPLCLNDDNSTSKLFFTYIKHYAHIKKFSFPKMRNRQFVSSPKIEYKLVAERSEAASNSLRFSKIVDYIINDWNFIMKEIKEFAELAKGYEDLVSSQLTSI